MCVFVGTGDAGGAVFKNYEHRTVQVNSRSFPCIQQYITNTYHLVANISQKENKPPLK